MASSWGSSWASSWGNSWGDTGGSAVVTSSGWRRLQYSKFVEKPRINWHTDFNGVYHEVQEEAFKTSQELQKQKKIYEIDPGNVLAKTIQENENKLEYLKSLVKEIIQLIKTTQDYDVQQFKAVPKEDEDPMLFVKQQMASLQKEYELKVQKEQRIEKLLTFLLETGRI